MAAKSVTELLINDYTRHGHVDGRALRLRDYVRDLARDMQRQLAGAR